jgi:putative transposase
MQLRGLVSAYTHKKNRVHTSRVNTAPVPNLIDRQFSNRLPGTGVISDLTYVRVGTQWAYISILPDLGTREIVGHSAGVHKNVELVHDAFASVKGNLFEILFHSDRGSKFDNMLMDELLDNFQIQRSLSMKDCLYDNEVAESTFEMIKAEFIASRRLDNLEHLRLELADYLHWFNHIRLHGILGYRSPVELRNACTL